MVDSENEITKLQMTILQMTVTLNNWSVHKFNCLKGIEG